MKFSEYFTHIVCFTSDQPHSKFPIAACGLWLVFSNNALLEQVTNIWDIWHNSPSCASVRLVFHVFCACPWPQSLQFNPQAVTTHYWEMTYKMNLYQYPYKLLANRQNFSLVMKFSFNYGSNESSILWTDSQISSVLTKRANKIK